MRIRFDRFTLDTERRELWRSDSLVALTPRGFDVLEYLVTNRHRVIAVDELREHVWKVAAISASAVPTSIASLRDALADDATSPAIIGTVRGRGYRFIASVEEDSPRLGTTKLVGRAVHIEAIQADLLNCLAGGPRLFVLRGASGTGKSWLLAEGGDLAERHGYRAIHVSIPETGRAPALWPWTEVVKRISGHRETRNAESPIHVELLPSASPAHERTDPSGPIDKARALFLRCERIAKTVGGATTKTPIAIVFDDFHRADGDSIRVLDHLLRNNTTAKLFILAASREPERSNHGPLELGVVSWPRTRVMTLHSFSFAEASEIVRSGLGARATPELISSLQEASGGNPFLLSQAIAAVAGGDEVDPSAIRSGGVLRAALSLARGLPDRSLLLLALGSVLGRAFDASTLARVADCNPSELVASLQPAVESALIQHDGGAGFRFAHLLIRDALYAEIPLRDRAFAHMRCADVLAESRAPSSEVAFHYGQAMLVGGAEGALRYSRRAAAEARRQQALDSVPRFLEAAVAASESCGALRTEDRLSLLADLGESQIAAARRTDGRATLERCVALATAAGDASAIARAALEFAPGSLALEVGVHDPIRERLLRSALRFRSELQPDVVAQLLAHYSLSIAWADRGDEQEAAASEALSLSETTTVPGTRAIALVAKCWVLGGPTNASKRRALIEQLGHIAQEVGALDLILMHRILNITSLAEASEFDRVASEIASYRADIETASLPHFRWYAEMFDAMNALRMGRFSEASALAEQFLQIGIRANDNGAVISYGCHCAYQLWETGRPLHAAALAEEFTSRYPAVSAWTAGLALFELDAGSADGARDRLERLFDVVVESPKHPVWTGGAALLAEGCSRLNMRTQASRLYDLLLPGDGATGMMGLSVVSAGPISRYLGVLAAALGRSDESISRLRSAIAQERRHQGVTWCTKSEIDLAEVLAQRRAPGDIDEALKVARGAANTARKTGLELIQARAERLVNRLG